MLLSSNMDFTEQISKEVKIKIFSHLDFGSLLACCGVCKKWNECINSSAKLWRQICLNAGFVVSQDQRDVEHWKKFYRVLSSRKRDMRKSAAFESVKYHFEFPITCCYCYKGKIALGFQNGIINIWVTGNELCQSSYVCGFEPKYVKFDDRKIFFGPLWDQTVSMDVTQVSEPIRYIHPGYLLATFDFSTDSNIMVSAYNNRTVVIWNLSAGIRAKTLTDHSLLVLNVLLSPYLLEDNCRQQKRFLFTMDHSAIFVRLIKSGSDTLTLDSITVEFLYGIPLIGSNNVANRCKPSLHFDGRFLYFPRTSSSGACFICKWDMETICFVSKLGLNKNFCSLLGIGKKYMAVLERKEHRKQFIVVDRETMETISSHVLGRTKEIIKVGDNDPIQLGNTSWLDGLDGENDRGFVCLYIRHSGCFGYLKWT